MTKYELLLYVIILTHLPSSIVASDCPEEDICDNHTMCVYKEYKIRVACDTVVLKVGIKNDEEIFITYLHNLLRKEVAAYEEDIFVSPYMPLPEKVTASNIGVVKWDYTLANYAQTYANTCFVRDMDDCRDMRHENGNVIKVQQLVHRIFISDSKLSTVKILTRRLWLEVLYAWYRTAQYIPPDIFNNFTPYVQDLTLIPLLERYQDVYDYSKFTQLVWAETNSIGCGYIAYHGNRGTHYLFVCNYAPAGNIEGKPVFKQGIPCTECNGTNQCNTRYKWLCSVNRAESTKVDEFTVKLVFLHLILYSLIKMYQ